MGVWKKIIIAAGAAVATLGLGMGVAFAVSDSTISGTTDHTIYKVGSSITITGVVNGDIFCAGQTVDIDATVNGDVICAGQSVTVSGRVNGNVRVAGQTVNVSAFVDRNATLAGQTANLQGGAKVGQDVGIAAQTANVDGPIGRDLRGAANTLALNDSIVRDVEANAQKLNLGSTANVGGDLTYTSPERLHEADGAVVSGKTTYHKSKPHENQGPRFGHFWFVKSLYVDLALLVFSMVLVALAPQLFVRWNKRAMTKSWPWQPLLTGFAAMFVVPVVIIVLLLTFVGIPLAVFTGLAWMLALMLSAPIAAFYVGSLIMRKERRAPLVMLVGSLVLGLICLVPVLGSIVTVVAAWFGTGNLLLNLKQLYRKPKYSA